MREVEIKLYQEEVELELHNILNYWEKQAVDSRHGGFYGFINTQNQVNLTAEKGLVLNARILWSFSAAYRQEKKDQYAQLAYRAYQYLMNHFVDKQFGGFYWSVDYQGKPLERHKQVYGQAFVIYALSEYYQIAQDPKALYTAIELFNLMEKHSFDNRLGGYYEALSEDWTPLADVRLSAKDANEKKTMNTHLHILEAYTNLYRVWDNKFLSEQIKGLLQTYQKHIIHPQKHYQHLFMDEDWTVKSKIVSYGHDIEASWLLWEAAEVLEDESVMNQIRYSAIHLAESALAGLDQDNGLNYECNLDTEHLDQDKHWWVQAEAMVGFLNSYQLTDSAIFLQQSWQSWQFTKKHIIDHAKGEWFWGVTPDYKAMNDTKVGFWKCPYHNVRACLEVMHRLDKIKNQTFQVSKT